MNRARIAPPDTLRILDSKNPALQDICAAAPKLIDYLGAESLAHFAGVQQILRDDYVLVALYTDDKTKVPENEWVTTAGGKVLKDIGRINSYIAQTRFGVNGQPNYLILGRDGQELVPKRAYNLDVEAYIDFLKSGVEAYNKTK